MSLTVEEAINKRKSVRSYSDEPLSIGDIEKLIWAASRVPSAGGIHPLEIRAVYDKDMKERLCQVALNQRCIAEAQVDLVISANYQKMMNRYGERGVRYAQMEAGHMGQNISLVAVSLGLGCVMIGAFRDKEVKKVLGIEEEPLYIIPVGRINAV